MELNSIKEDQFSNENLASAITEYFTISIDNNNFGKPSLDTLFLDPENFQRDLGYLQGLNGLPTANNVKAIYVNRGELVNADNMLQMELEFPKKRIIEIIYAMYRPGIILNTNSKKVKHPFLDRMVKNIIEQESIGFLIWENDVVGCAKVTTDTYMLKNKPVDYIKDIKGDTLYLQEKSLDNFLFEDASYHSSFQTTYLEPWFYNLLVSKNLFRDEFEAYQEIYPTLIYPKEHTYKS